MAHSDDGDILCCRGKHRSRSKSGLLILLVGFAAGVSFNCIAKLGTTPPVETISVGPSCPPTPPIEPFARRAEIGSILEKEGFRRGAEVGVQMGSNAHELLSHWESMEYFALVDLWAHQENYKDVANIDDQAHQALMDTAKQTLAQWSERLEYFRMLSTEAATQIPDDSLDFVYIDARHDYCGVTEDIDAYWPKLKKGGLLAGHDFKYASQVAPKQDWSLCHNGTVNDGAVRGAVENFVKVNNLQLVVGFGEDWSSWMVRKPLCEALETRH